MGLDDEGPVLVGAKLNHVEEPAGEAGVPFFGGAHLANDEHALYDEGDSGCACSPLVASPRTASPG